jgi:hypothetical protein
MCTERTRTKFTSFSNFQLPLGSMDNNGKLLKAREIITHYHRPSNSIHSRKHLLDNVSKTSSPKELQKIKRTFYLVPDNMPHIQMGFQCMSIKITIGAFQVPGRN